MSAVHFTGIENIVNAFRSKELPFFAVLSGKQILHKNDKETDIEAAAAELESFLNMLNQGSNAIYTLKIYEDLETGKIKEKTECDYSLNFRLNLEGMTVAGWHQNIAQSRSSLVDNTTEILNKLSVMEARLEAMEEDEEPEEENAINGLLKSPEIQTMLVGMIGNFLNPNKTKPTALAGINEAKIFEAIEILKQHDSQIDEDLMKLAEIATNNPSMFQMLLKTLRNF